MGREIRRVPPNWEHPQRECKHRPTCSTGRCFQPLYDRDFATEAREWKDRLAAWERGERPDYCDEESRTLEFWEWDGGPPERAYYRPAWTDEERTWLQVYETVSEGTPVSPAFATREELIEYLVTHGDYWDQSRGDGGWQRANAESFVGRGWAPSMMTVATACGTEVYAPRDGVPTDTRTDTDRTQSREFP